MDSQRQQKYARLIQKEVSDIFMHDMAHNLVIPGERPFITVSHVKVSPDLGVATIYLSILGSTKQAQIIEQIQELTPRVRGVLGRRMRNQARIIPDLRFFLDNTAEEADRIDKLIAGLNIPKE